MQPPLNVGKIDYFLGVPKFLRRVSFFSFRFNVKANSHYVGGNNVFGKDLVIITKTSLFKPIIKTRTNTWVASF